MFSYALLLIGALYLVMKWISYHRYKKTLKPLQQIDMSLISTLNRKEGQADAE